MVCVDMRNGNINGILSILLGITLIASPSIVKALDSTTVKLPNNAVAASKIFLASGMTYVNLRGSGSFIALDATKPKCPNFGYKPFVSIAVGGTPYVNAGQFTAIYTSCDSNVLVSNNTYRISCNPAYTWGDTTNTGVYLTWVIYCVPI